MRRSLLRVAEVMTLRGGPGLINVAAIVLIGDRLGVEPFGHFSTAVATSVVCSSILFGPVMFSIVAEYSAAERVGRQAAYEGGIVSLIAAAVALGVLAAPLPAPIGPTAGLIAATGAFNTLQEFLRARIRIWAFGGCALVQALLSFALAFLLLPRGSSMATALWLYAASYGVAALVSYAAAGLPRPHRIDAALLRKTFRIGTSYTFASVAENGIVLGARYAALLFGSAQTLGTFSFCLDVATRFIGFVASAVSFAFVPMAFRDGAGPQDAQFGRTLRTGALLAMALASVAAVLVLVVWWSGLVPTLNNGLFDPVIFLIAAFGATINRVRKLSVDPFAMRDDRTHVLVTGYIVAVPVTILVAILSLAAGIAAGPAAALALGYGLAAAISWRLLRPRREPAVAP